MNRERNNWWPLSAKLMLQKSLACLISTDIVSIQILLYFILVLTQLHSGVIVALLEVLVNILDGVHIEGEFYIDVILHLEEEERRIENDPSVVHCKTMNFMLYTSVPTTIF